MFVRLANMARSILRFGLRIIRRFYKVVRSVLGKEVEMVEKIEDVTSVQKSVAPVEQASVGEKKSKLWLWIVIALVVIGVIALAWWLI